MLHCCMLWTMYGWHPKYAMRHAYNTCCITALCITASAMFAVSSTVWRSGTMLPAHVAVHQSHSQYTVRQTATHCQHECMPKPRACLLGCSSDVSLKCDRTALCLPCSCLTAVLLLPYPLTKPLMVHCHSGRRKLQGRPVPGNGPPNPVSFSHHNFPVPACGLQRERETYSSSNSVNSTCRR